MKKLLAMVLMTGALAGLTACSSNTVASGGDSASSGSTSAQSSSTSAPSSSASASSGSTSASMGAVTVVSREDGSGTRGAFIELFEIEQKDASGEKVDYTTDDAEITNSTSVMMTTIAGNKSAIGYISLGSLNDSVKAVTIDGAEATAENIKTGDYKIARPFMIVVNETVSDTALDFMAFINSADGQQIVEDNQYISQGNEGAYQVTGVSGKLVIAGSSSVTPVMEKLKEAYVIKNPDVVIEIQQSDSTTGVTSVIDGICDIGMVSRELKDSEKEAGLEATVIAMDGIAVIVNHENPMSGLSSEAVKAIFTGETGDWADVQ